MEKAQARSSAGPHPVVELGLKSDVNLKKV
jgi:hypothetical protein